MRGLLLLCAGMVAVLGLAGEAGACRDDSQCPGGHRCVKVFGGLYGACQRGGGPIDRDERVRPHDPLRPKGGLGKPCEFDEDCLSGLRCETLADKKRRACARP